MSIRYLSGINVDSNTLFVDSANDRVGIGTGSPTAKLQLYGSGLIDLNVTSTNNQALLYLQGTFGQVENNVGDFYITNSAPSSPMIFRTATTERMRITSAGNVGIGTTAPGAKLEVSGNWKLGDISGGSFKSYTFGTELDISGLISGGWARSHKITTSDTSGNVFFGVLGNNTTLTRAYWTIGDPSSIDSTGYNSGNGIILLKNGNVGIGTTAPNERLHVGGNISVVALTGSKIGFNTTDAFVGYGTSIAHYGISYGWNANPLALSGYFGVGIFTDGSEKVRVLANGNVGIGTTAPGAKLDVDGGIWFNGRVEGRTFPYNSTFGSGADATTTTLDAGSTNTYRSSIILAGGSATDPNTIKFLTTSAERMRITSGGNVGIGTTSPSSMLTLNGTTPYIRLERSGVPTWELRQNFPSTEYGFQIVNVTAGTIPFFVGNSGNVGIGTTSPNALLHVTTSSTTGTTSMLLLSRASGYGHTLFEQIYDSTYFTAGKTLTLKNDAGTAFIHFAGNNAGTQTNVLIPTGNVGIGTTSPAYQLTLNKNDNNYLQIRSSDTGAAGIYFGRQNDSVRGSIYYDNNADALYFQTNNLTTNTVITSAGALLVGTTSTTNTASGKIVNRTGGSSNPDLALNGGGWSIASISGEPALYLSSNIAAATGIPGATQTAKGGIGFEYVNAAAPTDLVLGIFGSPTVASSVRIFNNTERVRITNAGDVGIGMTSPAAKLDVSGSIQAGSGSTFGTGSNGASIYMSSASGLGLSGNLGGYSRNLIKTDGSSVIEVGDASTSLISAINISAGDDTGVIALKTGGNNTRLYVNSSGNVGIGTTSPAQKLEVSGSAAGDFAALSLSNTNQSGTADGLTVNFKLGRTVDSFLFTIPAIKFVKEQQWTSTPATVDGALLFSTILDENVNERMRINSAGNVGIGNSSPQANGASAVLDVGNGSGGTLNLRDTNTGLAAEGFNQIFGGDNRMYLYAGGSGASSYMQFYTNDVERMRLTSDGHLIVKSTTSGGGTQGDFYVIENGGLVIDASEGATQRYIEFTTGGTTKMLIAAAGNVGIGSTSPGAKLHVNSDGTLNEQTIVVGISSVSQRPTIQFSEGSTVEAGTGMSIEYDGRLSGTENKMYINGVDNVPKMTVMSGGNVGIGTTSPSVPLHVVGNILVTGTSPTFSGGALEIQGTANAVKTLYINRYGVASGSQHRLRAENAYFEIASANSEPIVLTGGNVGIGTTSPTNKLTVTTATNAVDVLRLNNTGGDSGSVQGVTHLAINHFNSGTNPSTRITAYQDSTSGWPGGMYFSTRSLNTDSAPVERMRITSAGNVGIGTTSPQYMLDVNGDAQINAIGDAPSNTYVPDGAFGVDNLITSGTENVALGKPDVWLRIHVDGVAFVFPGYQEP